MPLRKFVRCSICNKPLTAYKAEKKESQLQIAETRNHLSNRQGERHFQLRVKPGADFGQKEKRENQL